MSGILYGQDEDANEKVPPVDPGPIPEHLFDVPGFVREVMDFTLDNAPYPNVGLAFCGAMALQSVLAGRKVRTESDLRTNLYLLALAASGTGKDFPRKVNSHVLFRIGMAELIKDKFASGEGIQDALLNTATILFQTDEMDGVLRKINADREDRHESIPNVLLTLYSSASDVYPMRVKAGKWQSGYIDQPHVTLFGTATPQYFYESLSRRMLQNGFFARLTIVDVGHRGDGQEPSSVRNISESIIEKAKWWADFRPGASGNLQEFHPEPPIAPFDPDAAEAVEQLRRMAEVEYDKAQKENNEEARTVWSRTCEHAMKLSLVYACSDRPQSPIISLPTVEWATKLAVHQARRQLYLASVHVAENPFHAECLKLIRKLKEAGGQMRHSQLMRSMHLKAKEFEEIIATLVQQGDIVALSVKEKTKPFKVYKLVS